MDIKNIYWLAGLLEGEGSFSMQPTSPRIQLNMTDEDVVLKARSLMYPISKIFINNSINPKHKTAYRFSIHGSLAIQWMMTLYPLMGRRRKEKIREVVKIWKDVALSSEKGSFTTDSVLIRKLAKHRNISYDEAKKLFESTVGIN